MQGNTCPLSSQDRYEDEVSCGTLGERGSAHEKCHTSVSSHTSANPDTGEREVRWVKSRTSHQ